MGTPPSSLVKPSTPRIGTNTSGEGNLPRTPSTSTLEGSNQVPRNYIKRGLALFTLIGISTTVGSIEHGHLSLQSVTLAVVSFVALTLVNITERK